LTLITPLEWPITSPRHKSRATGLYRTGVNPITGLAAISRLEYELEKFGARNAELYGQFGYTRGGNVSSQWGGGDPGAVVRYDVGKIAYTLPCDTFSELAQNIAALAAHIEAVRKIERIGVASIAQAMGAFAQLPAPPKQRPWHEVLGVAPTAQIKVIMGAYRALAKINHPDVGGEKERMQEINRALQEAKARI
jgi:DnaJ-domain-containing protein 1